MRYALVNAEGKVDTVIEWDGVSKWVSPAGTTAMRSDEAQPGDALVDGGFVRWHLRSVEAAREWALAEVAAIAESRTTVVLPDGIRYAVGDEAQRSWSSLLHTLETAAKLGAPVDWPIPFVAADGTVVDLDDATEARALYLTLFAAGDRLRRRAMVATWAIQQAATVADIILALEAYAGEGGP